MFNLLHVSGMEKYFKLKKTKHFLKAEFMINGRIRGFQLHNIRMYFIFRILFFIWAIVIEKYDAQNILDPSDVAQVII